MTEIEMIKNNRPALLPIACSTLLKPGNGCGNGKTSARITSGSA